MKRGCGIGEKWEEELNLERWGRRPKADRRSISGEFIPVPLLPGNPWSGSLCNLKGWHKGL